MSGFEPGFQIFQGQLNPPLSWTLLDGDGDVVDLTGASTVAFHMRASNSATDATLAGAAAFAADRTTGVVTFAWGAGDTSVAGQYRGRFVVTWPSGGDEQVSEFDITILATAPGPTDLCTVYDVREAMRIPKQMGSNFDAQIQAYITMASDRIQNEYGHFRPYETAATKRFLVRRYRARLFPYFLAQNSITQVMYHPESFQLVLDGAVPDYFAEPYQTLEGCYTAVRLSPWIPAVSPTSMRFGNPLVSITANWGYQTVPNAVRLATIITVRAWMLRDAAAYSTTVQSEDPSITPRPAGTYALPNAAREHLDLFTPTIGVA